MDYPIFIYFSSQRKAINNNVKGLFLSNNINIISMMTSVFMLVLSQAVCNTLEAFCLTVVFRLLKLIINLTTNAMVEYSSFLEG